MTVVLSCAAVLVVCIASHYIRKRRAENFSQSYRVRRVSQQASTARSRETTRQGTNSSSNSTQVTTRVNTRVSTRPQGVESYTESSNTWERAPPSNRGGVNNAGGLQPGRSLNTARLNPNPQDCVDDGLNTVDVGPPMYSQTLETPTSRSVEVQGNPRIASGPHHSTISRLPTSGSFANKDINPASSHVTQETSPHSHQATPQFDDGLEDLIQDLQRSIQEEYVIPTHNSLPRMPSRRNTLPQIIEAQANPRIAADYRHSFTAPRAGMRASPNRFSSPVSPFDGHTSSASQDTDTETNQKAVLYHPPPRRELTRTFV